MKLSLSWLARHRPYIPAAISGILLGAASLWPELGWIIFIAFIPSHAIAAELPQRVFEDNAFLPIKKFFVIAFRVLTFQFLWRRNIKVFKYDRRMVSAATQLFRYDVVTTLIWQSIAASPFLLPTEADAGWQAGLSATLTVITIVFVNALLFTIPQQLAMRISRFVDHSWSMFILPMCWVAFEYLYPNWVLAWPWSSLSFVMSGYAGWLGISSVLGPSAIVLLIILTNTLLYQAIRSRTIMKKSLIWGGSALSVLLLFLLPPVLMNDETEGEKITVRIVQPNFQRDDSGEGMTRMEKMDLLLNLVSQQPWDTSGLVILPENVLPKPMTKKELSNEDLLQNIRSITYKNDVDIVAGFTELVRYNKSDAPATAEPAFGGKMQDRIISAAHFADGELKSIYRKQRHLPVIERLPIPGVISFMQSLIGLDSQIDDQFGEGLAEGEFEAAEKLPFRVFIGSEVGFPGDILENGEESLVNLVLCNDNELFGEAQIRYLHQSASLLAVLTSRPAIVVSNKGYSAVHHPNGESETLVKRNAEGVADVSIVKINQSSFYERNGNVLGFVSIFLVLAGVIFAFIRYYFPRKHG